MQIYKIGDRVVCEKSNIDWLIGSMEDKVGTIVNIMRGADYPYQIDFGNDLKLYCKVKGYAATEETNVNDFKVGDRVTYKGHPGTVIAIGGEAFVMDMLGIEFDEPGIGLHNCGGFNLKAGAMGTKCNSLWRYTHEVVRCEAESAIPETPETEYFNGKVVCIADEHPDQRFYPIPGFTVGRIYEVVDGCITNDNGWKSPIPCKDIEELSSDMGRVFIGVVA